MSQWAYTKEDFENSLEPYERLAEIKNPFELERSIKSLSAYAASVGYKGFTKVFKEYQKSLKMQGDSVYIGNATNFTGQPLELECGRWDTDDCGVYQQGMFGSEVVVPHPILPVERLVNVDTGDEKLKLAFKKGSGNWRTIIVDKKVLASANKVTELAGRGIAVTSETAKAFIRYISELENLNFEIIPEKQSIGRLGYIHGYGFSPYVEGLLFDGDANFQALFQAVKSHGQYERWKQTALECRDMSTTAKILLAASFASPLLEPLGALPFFVHLWGVDSGTGKTVALMVAASVWGNPNIGAYIKTFDATVVGHEKTAAFLNHLPLCLDELQLAKDGKGRTQFDVYKLAQGVGRTRANRGGGVDLTPTWRNTILTTGESPLTGQNAGAGAINRVIDIECVSGSPVITEGNRISSLVKNNYGFAGREFVERLYRSGEADSKVKVLYDVFFQQLSEQDTTEKQAMAAAAILTADTLACEWVFGGQAQPLTVEEISSFLASKAAVSLGERGYSFLCDWVAANANRLSSSTESSGEVYGDLSDDRAYIIRTVFNRVVEEAGYSQKALLSYLRQKRLIDVKIKKGRVSGFTIAKRINGVVVDVVALHLPQENPAERYQTTAYDEEPL